MLGHSGDQSIPADVSGQEHALDHGLGAVRCNACYIDDRACRTGDSQSVSADRSQVVMVARTVKDHIGRVLLVVSTGNRHVHGVLVTVIPTSPEPCRGSVSDDTATAPRQGGR